MRIRRILQSDHLSGWAFAFPAVFLIFVFGIVPVVWSALLSFQHTNLLSPPQWIGTANYRALAKDPLFRQSAVHSLVYTALFVPLSVAGGLLAAIALNRRIRGVRFYRTAVFVPVVLSTIATAIMFLWLLDPDFGLVNFLLSKLGLGPYGFFDSASGALYSIVGMTVWGWIGFDVIIYLAALQGIPPSLVEEVYFITNGGPGTATYVVVYYLFSLAFQQGVAGYAAAIAYVLLIAILSLTVVQLWVGRRLVYYAS